MGVKSLWSLLTPVGRPVMLETVEGTTMAIDSSIWIYQFQATMRDKEGNALINAHVLGFLRRISKLLFYGIKPVFVFDGGAPALKRATLNERKKKKSGAAASHTKLAEKLLAAHMRKEALKHAQNQSGSNAKVKGKAEPGQVPDDDAVYLEDIDPTMLKTPARKDVKGKVKDTSSTPTKKNKFHDHDPYRLPDVDLEEAVAKATRSTVPDPRLATEDELQAFIDEMRPEDFDVTSPAFQELPTEVQYEIVGDLRLKSRQTSYKRLEAMLHSARTPLDFSKQQINNLRQRNALTQQLLTTTDSIGKAHISIPVRIASERNKEYVLVKNEGAGGGWILGIRDDGTKENPIEIDQAPVDITNGDDEDSDFEMEQVDIPQQVAPDADLQEYHREIALSAIAKRRVPKPRARLQKKAIDRETKSVPLFQLDGDDDDDLDFAIQQSFDDLTQPVDNSHDRDLPLASTSVLNSGDWDDVDDDDDLAIQSSLHDSLADSHERTQTSTSSPVNAHASSSTSSAKLAAHSQLSKTPSSHHFSPSTRLETALSIANTGSAARKASYHTPKHIASSSASRPLTPMTTPPSNSAPTSKTNEHIPSSEGVSEGISFGLNNQKEAHTSRDTQTPVHLSAQNMSDSDMEEVSTREESFVDQKPSTATHLLASDSDMLPEFYDVTTEVGSLKSFTTSQITAPTISQSQNVQPVDSLEDEALIHWSRSPSPVANLMNTENSSRPASPMAESWDAAQEMDPQAEEGDFVHFISQVKGKKLDDVQREIEDEIKTLNKQKKAAMRDSEDVTQQMIAQIMTMLRLFGIPYITAPMEAEAQCAELVSLGLVDGIITDDSDVFLFGGKRVYKNMFNQSKTVECFLLSDLARELGLDRDTLVRLAYLLGSDYVDGLPGVGPVVAMELLKEFPGEDGLHKFKDWWTRVQTGKDKEEDNKSKFRRSFKKRFKDLYLEQEWPPSAVRDAYYHPVVDSSDEPFKWGLPDLDGLRDFLREELGWNHVKVDELLSPIIQKMGKRQKEAALNKQGNLNGFFDVTVGSGTYAPRKRQPYKSKRLQQVVTDYRNQQAQGQGSSGTTSSSTPGPGDGNESDSGTEEEGPARKKSKTAAKAKGKGKTRPPAEKTKKGKGKGKGRKKSKLLSDSEDDFEGGVGGDDVEATPLLAVQLRPRPKPAYKGAAS